MLSFLDDTAAEIGNLQQFYISLNQSCLHPDEVKLAHVISLFDIYESIFVKFLICLREARIDVCKRDATGVTNFKDYLTLPMDKSSQAANFVATNFQMNEQTKQRSTMLKRLHEMLLFKQHRLALLHQSQPAESALAKQTGLKINRVASDIERIEDELEVLSVDSPKKAKEEKENKNAKTDKCEKEKEVLHIDHYYNMSPQSVHQISNFHLSNNVQGVLNFNNNVENTASSNATVCGNKSTNEKTASNSNSIKSGHSERSVISVRCAHVSSSCSDDDAAKYQMKKYGKSECASKPPPPITKRNENYIPTAKGTVPFPANYSVARKSNRNREVKEEKVSKGKGLRKMSTYHGIELEQSIFMSNDEFQWGSNENVTDAFPKTVEKLGGIRKMSETAGVCKVSETYSGGIRKTTEVSHRKVVDSEKPLSRHDHRNSGKKRGSCIGIPKIFEGAELNLQEFPSEIKSTLRPSVNKVHFRNASSPQHRMPISFGNVTARILSDDAVFSEMESEIDVKTFDRTSSASWSSNGAKSTCRQPAVSHLKRRQPYIEEVVEWQTSENE
eukprot:Platyproteum_vivax@DN4040_c0_g1_i3.p1